MGWTVLYIAFGIVALWLLGEVLLQYKARLRWRLLAFTGFMGVVLGVLIPSIYVIALGAIAFAVGQTYVTLSFRRGFSTGWAIGGSPGASRRRKAGKEQAEEREPALEVSDLEYEPPAYDPAQPPAYDPARPAAYDPVEPPAPAAAVYEPEPLPDDTGQYGIYDDAAREAPHQQQPHAGAAAGVGGHEYGGGYDAYPGYGHGQQQQPTGHDGYVPQDAYHSAQDMYPGQDAYAQQQQQYGYDVGQHQQYAAYTDPYTGSVNSGEQYGSYDSFGGRQQYADPYAGQQQYGGETPPGGVWVPQQRDRDGEQFPPTPQEEPRRPGYTDPDHNEQHYRY
ncbi:hypothetical protein ABTZ59_21035 [Streptomyces sp. NPDC094034]|uniref:hypothetical protein n=1 Tax=Streptomyces sp. NPDC094034 TaxID=3155309 RepID=UPI0033168916